MRSEDIESVSEMSEYISSRPWGEKNVGNFVEEDEVELRWGLGLGALLMVAAGVHPARSSSPF